MNKADIDKLNTLDPRRQSGTIQGALHRDDLNITPFADILFWLLKQSLVEKETLVQENKKLVGVLKRNGLYTSENIL